MYLKTLAELLMHVSISNLFVCNKTVHIWRRIQSIKHPSLSEVSL